MNNLIALPVSELKTALTGLTKVACRSSCLPVLQSVRVTRDKSGLVNLQATDLDSFATYQTEQPQPGPACEFLVPMESLTKLVKKSSGKDNIGLMGEDGGKVTIRTFVGTSPVDQTVPSVKAKEWPPVPRCELPAVTLNQDIRAAVASAMECSGEDSTRPLLHGAWIDPTDPKAHYVLATDGRHLFTANSFCVDFKEPVLLPNKKFVQWNGFMDDGDWKVSIQSPAKKDQASWLQVQSVHWTFISKMVEGQCPNWRNAVPSPSEAKTLIRLSNQALEFLQQLLPKLPGGDALSRPVTLEIQNQTLTVKAHPKNSTDWTKVTVPETTITGKPMSITLNRDYLIKALGFGLVNVDLYDELSPLVFQEGGKRMVVMPIRLDSGSPPPANVQQTPAQPAENVTAETTTAASPTPETTNPQPEERKEDMAKTTTEPSAVETPASNETGTKTILQHVEQIKDSLKGVIRDLNDLLDTVKKAEKEKKASEKDIEAVREKLREIQSVKL